MSGTITIPKKALEEMLVAGRRFAAAEDALEDAIFASNRTFVRNMRRLRREHVRGHMGEWQALKERHGI